MIYRFKSYVVSFEFRMVLIVCVVTFCIGGGCNRSFNGVGIFNRTPGSDCESILSEHHRSDTYNRCRSGAFLVSGL